MRIPKSKMRVLIHALDVALSSERGGFNEEETELLNQIVDKAAQCHHGDGTELHIEIYYGN